MLGKRESMSVGNPDNRGPSAGALRRRKSIRRRRFLLAGIAAVLLIAVGLGTVLFFRSRDFGAPENVTVTFDSTGGSEVESQTVARGTTLSAVGDPEKYGYIFCGWFYEEAPVNAYLPEDKINENMTLYAGWVEPQIEADFQEYIRDCNPDVSFVVRSEKPLTDDNLSQFIEFSCVDPHDSASISVVPEGDSYRLSAMEGFTPGRMYTIRILDKKTCFFEKAGNQTVSDPGIGAYSFRIYKENMNNVVKKAEPKLLSSDAIGSFETIGTVSAGQTGLDRDNGKSIYRILLAGSYSTYEVGDIVSVGNGEEDAAANQYYKVIEVSKNAADPYINVIDPSIEDIYSTMEIYFDGEAVSYEQEQDAEELEEIRALEQDIQVGVLKSDGYRFLSASIAKGIKESPTVQSTVAALGPEYQKRFADLKESDLTDLLTNIRVSVRLDKTYNSMNKENGVRGTIEIAAEDITIPLGSNVNLTINLRLKNTITQTAYSYIMYYSDNQSIDENGVYVNNVCDITFDAVISTSNGEDKVNITQELENLVNSVSKNKTQEIVDSLNEENYFGDDLSYVEIVNKELGNKTVSIYEVLTVQFKLNFHIDIGMRVGLVLNFHNEETRMISTREYKYSDGHKEMERVNNRLYSRTHFSALLKGQIGIRAGFKAEVNFSMLHLNSVFNIGFVIDIGVYEEISGFVRFDYDSVGGMSMAGGLVSETGIYLSLEFSWNLFGWEDSVIIAEFKFPILTIGTSEFATEFEKTEEEFTFNTKTYNVMNNGNQNLLALKHVDISGGSNGVVINIKPAASNADYEFYVIKDQRGIGSKDDINYVSINRDSGMITIKDNAPERLDFTVGVHYKKGNSLFNAKNEPITKLIHMTYMKINVGDSAKKYTASFYGPKDALIEKKEFYVGQIPVPPEYTAYQNMVIYTPYKMVDWAKPWKEEVKAIYADTAYHLDVETNNKNISYYGMVYNKGTGKYQYGLIATIPSVCGEMPTPPKEKDMVTEPGWKFDGWSPALRTVQTDYSYTASYRQDPDYALYNFYVDGACISNGFVKKGQTPAAPDMSGYQTQQRAFFGWSPSVGPVNTNYQSYYAYFRNYIKVTFKDREGTVISEQKLLAGEKPSAPAVTSVYPGEESYYEYRFSKWTNESGAELGQVYKDEVFSAKYKKTYLPVTTVFDASEHTFSDGTKRKEFTGTYAPFNFLYLPQVSFSSLGRTYAVDYWQSTEKVNGSYVKLYMKDRYTEYKYNLTFKPVYNEGEPITYTVRFDGGDTPVTLTGLYGEVITADMLTDLKKTSPSENYTYVLSDYGLTLPYSFGSTIGPDGQPASYISVVVRFDLVAVDKTYTFDANGGAFADGETTKKVIAPYATESSFTQIPEKKEDTGYTYEFAGWADTPDAATGESYEDFIIISDRTLYAVYAKTVKEYTVTFNANGGNFADGKNVKTVTATYDTPCSFREDPQKEADAKYSYDFLGWGDTPDAVTGESFEDFVMTGSRTVYAVYAKILREYTVTFNANGGKFADNSSMKTVTALYDAPCSFEEDPLKNSDVQYSYTFLGWADTPDAVVGESYDDFIMTGNRTLYAIFGKTTRSYTVTFNANGGSFPDNTTTKSITEKYGLQCSFVEVPAKTGDPGSAYEFIGWAETANATSGMSYADFIMTGSRTLYAVYTQSSVDYRVSFDLNGGNIGGVSSTVIQIYAHGDTITPPADPQKSKDATNRYVFTGWQPAIPEGTTATQDITYTAQYRSVRIDGAYPETGITVTDGTNYEDICVNSISGYSYSVVDKDPVLIVTDDGLTFSGEGDVVFKVSAAVTDLTLENFHMTGFMSVYNNSMDITMVSDHNAAELSLSDPDVSLTIHVSGSCSIQDSAEIDGYGDCIRFERLVELTGIGSGSKLTIEADNGFGVYCADDFDVTSLELQINASNVALSSDEGTDLEWSLNDSVVRLTSQTCGLYSPHSLSVNNSDLTIDAPEGSECNNLRIQGGSSVHLTASSEDANALTLYGDLTFADFTGQFNASSTHATNPGIAVWAWGQIVFIQGGSPVNPDGIYDLGGALIAGFNDETYRSFGIYVEGILAPAAVVSVIPL